MKSRSFNLLVILALFLSLLGGAVTVTPAYAASIVVNSNADNTLVNLNGNGTCDLREAITNANGDNQSGSTECPAGSGTDTITFSADYTITLNSGSLSLSSNITITGNGATKTIIQASTCNPVTLPGGCTPATDRVFIIASGNAILNDMTVRHGYCPSCITGGTNGSGIWNSGTLTINNSSISDNKANDGGGIWNNGTLTLTNSLISGNSAVNGMGGGVYNLGTLIIANSIFNGNSAFNGGGLVNDGIATITNSTFNASSASFVGGVGGIYNLGGLNLLNTIIANSTNGDCIVGILGSIGIEKNNLITGFSHEACDIVDGVNGSITGSAANLDVLADNGGSTQTIALLVGSPAIDAGDSATCAAAIGAPNYGAGGQDQRGVTRPQGAGCDIGAYETGPIIPVVTASNPSANATLTSLTTINVTFNQDMKNDGSSEAANTTTNYLLVERGTNGTFDTLSCNGGLVADDVPQTINTATYNNLVFMSTLTLANPLTNGTYRLFICGTTSIWSVAGLELNNGANDATVDFTIGVAAGTGNAGNRAKATSASSLPKTGFAPNKITSLPAQPAELAYAELGNLWLEIPSLNVKSSIVGVPQNADLTWDVSWLGNNTGWLNGTAYPTWNGNSVLTAHVTNADGLAGPFAALKQVKYGDQIIVHLGGAQYIYEVRETKLSRPYATSYAFESKQDASYITLVTCSGYNPLNESYLFRRVVRAVLIEVK